MLSKCRAIQRVRLDGCVPIAVSAAIIQLHVFIMYTFREDSCKTEWICIQSLLPGSQLVTSLIDTVSILIRVGREDRGDLYACLYILGMPVNCHVSEFYNINLTYITVGEDDIRHCRSL